jgi:hypothetical protein
VARVSRILVMMLVLVAACGSGGKGKASARDAGPSDSYQAGLAPLAKLEGEALEAVAAHMGDKYTSDEDLVAALKNTALPRYRDFVAGLEKLSPPPAKAELHKRLLTLAHAELTALEHLADGVARGDGNTVLEVNREQQRLTGEIDGLLASWSGVAAAPAPVPAAPQAASTPSSDANEGKK